MNSNRIPGNSENITRSELRNVLRAMDRQEFEGYMDEYIKEVSNPENVKESNQYLREAEEKNDLPKNVKLAQPSKGFCIKSTKMNIKRPGVKQKVFVNICSYEGIKKPTNENNYWSLPFLLNKGRNDQDKKGKLCITYDVVFHPEAIIQSKNLSFKKFVSDTAINGLNNNLLKEAGEKISSDYVVVTKYDYKGTEVAYMNIHGLNKGEFDAQIEPKEGYQTQIQKEIEAMKNKPEEEEEKVFDKPDVDIEGAQIDIENCEKISKQKPEYKIIYSDKVDMTKYFYNPNPVSEDQYQKLVIELKVPRLENINDAELQLDVKHLNFVYKDVYELDIDLPVEIDKNKSQAKFDRKKNILSISADIVRKIKETLKPKEDDNIEFVLSEEETKEEKKDENKIENIQRTIENQTSKESINEIIEQKQTEKVIKNQEIVNKEIQQKKNDKQSIEEIPKKPEHPKPTLSNELKELEGKIDTIEKKPEIQQLPNKITPLPQKDEDDIAPIQNNRKDFNNIIFFNFNCDLVYEID